MARKTYSEEFRQQAVDLYLNTPGATFKGIASDLGIARGTLQNWVYAQHPEGRPTPQAATPTPGAPAKSETAAARIARLEAALAAELAGRTSTAADPRPPEVRTTGTGRKRRAARRRAAAVRG